MSFPNLSMLAVQQRAVTLFFLILSVIAGIYAFNALGRAEDPSFTVKATVVNVFWPGATPEELQTQVVDHLEKRIQEVEAIYKIDSTIRPGQAALQIEFQDFTPSTEIPNLLYQVRKRMQEEQGRLPAGVIGPVVNDDFSDVFFSLIALSAPGMPMRELSRDAERIRDRLQQIQGVHKAILIGERPERVYVEFDAARLLSLGTTPQHIFEAIAQSNQLMPAGRMETAGARVYMRIDADLADMQQLSALPVRIGDQLLKLSDLATIRRGYEEPATFLVRAAGEDAILLGVVMNRGANGLALGERLYHFLDEERARLPLGMSLSVLTKQSDAIVAAVDLFQVKFLVAVIVVVAVSILAIGLRAGIVIGIAVPLTLGITFLIMMLMGINFDRITLGALIIALGLLVDDAIIAVEMMLVKMEEGWSKVRSAGHAWTVTAAPMLFGTLVTVAGFFPIGFARSGVGEYAGNIFWVLAISLLVSWFVAVYFVPYLGVKLLPKMKANQEHHDPYNTPRYQQLRRLIQACVHHRKLVVSGTLGLLVLSIIGMATVVEKQFFPSSDRPEVVISVFLPQGSSIQATDQTVRNIEQLLIGHEDVISLASYIGAGAPRFFISANPEPPSSAFAKIVAVSHDVAARERLASLINKHIEAGDFPEARVRVSRLLYGPPVIWPVAFRVMGPDGLVVRDIANQVREVMAQHPHMVDPHLEWQERTASLRLAMDEERLRLLGLTAQDVARQLQFQLDGITITQVRQDIRTVDVVARAANAGQRLDASSLDSIEIQTRQGRTIALAQIGELEVVFEDPVIKRYNRQLYIAVQGDIQNAQANDVSAQVWQQIADIRAQLPQDYRIMQAGSVEQSGKANASLQKLQPAMIAFMLIFIMLQMRSFTGTFIVVATAPLGIIGAVMALLLFSQPFGFVALLGLTGLAGILMRNTLILTQQVSDNFDAGMSAFDGVVEAAVQRARPVILTALAAMLAFVPLTLDSFWGPLAYVLIGGVAIGTAITLLFVPALYALWFKIEAHGA
ncbi:MAG: efflux RND transporter permease subunit [Bacterioplanes sp.]|nr:efflux RND transporter permease subunit [Bacterioplanes sp.]